MTTYILLSLNNSNSSALLAIPSTWYIREGGGGRGGGGSGGHPRPEDDLKLELLIKQLIKLLKRDPTPLVGPYVPVVDPASHDYRGQLSEMKGLLHQVHQVTNRSMRTFLDGGLAAIGSGGLNAVGVA